MMQEHMAQIRILFVCLGNICRSPMAEFVMRGLVKDAGLSHRITVLSAATSSWEIGSDIHPGSQKVMQKMGVPFSSRRARQMTKADYANADLLVGMDAENVRDMTLICGGDPEGKIRLLMSFSGEERDVDDPWYTGDFDATYRDVLRGCQALLEQLKKVL